MAYSGLDLLICKVVSIIENEASLLASLGYEFSELKHELVSMKSFLEDAGNKGGLTKGQESWVASVSELADHVEDFIDEYLHHMNKPFGTLVFLPNNFWVRHKLSRKLQKIKAKAHAISGRRQRYGINGIEGAGSTDDQRWVRKYAESTLFFKDDELVGIKADKDLLLGWLTNKEFDRNRTVISVVGMGGSGKTTLVAKVYNSQIVKRHFDCYAWITVSQSYDIEDLLRTMVQEFYESTNVVIPVDLKTMSYKQLVQTLLNYLQPRRYVLVLDDVWSGNLWRDIYVALPDEELGSRVILTSRNDGIASSSFGVTSYVHRVRQLQEHDAWILFCTKAFTNNPGKCCPGELQAMAQNLVRKCGGLPLAIVALGGVMSSKKLESEWRRVNGGLDLELRNNAGLEPMKSILLLSFNVLPPRLKCCFLHCCLFPEDYEIQRKRLIRIWIAEGFVEAVKGITLEEVAESYLMELICRSMLQVVRRNSLGRPCRFKMHDLMRELALSISKSRIAMFNDMSGVAQEDGEEIGGRFLSIQSSNRELKSWKGMLRLRSLFIFGTDSVSKSLDKYPHCFRLLRVLDLQDVCIVKLPENIVDLYNLRYLNLKNTKVKELPKYIGRLQHLETLNMFNTEVKVIPNGITKLKNLRHLNAIYLDFKFDISFESPYGVSIPSNICKLTNLQVLAYVEANAKFVGQLGNLTQLTRLGIMKLRAAYEEELCRSIKNMPCLRHLSLIAEHGEEFPPMDALLLPGVLRVLCLGGKMAKVPRWLPSISSLREMHLYRSKLGEDLLTSLQRLPNLQTLWLTDAYTGSKLNFSKGFQKLVELRLYDFPQLKEIMIEKGVMTDIKILYLCSCTALKRLPRGIEYLSYLEELILVSVSKDLIESISGEEGADYPRIQHVPRIRHLRESPSAFSYRLTPVP